MSRTPFFGQLARALRIARLAEAEKISTSEALERAAELQAARDRQLRTRREFLGNVGRAAAAAGLASIAAPFGATEAFAKPPGGGGSGPDVAIIGAGLAGLVCAEKLRAQGIVARVYEASSRAGGRCWSLPGFFPGQVAERGGEFIDNLHKQMLKYAQAANLAKEDLEKQPGEIAYRLLGQHWPESAIVDRYREFVDAMHADLRDISGDVTADDHNAFDVEIDSRTLAEYLDGDNGNGEAADPLLRAAIASAYEGEYGLKIDEQSCLNFLLFIHADKRSKMRWFGVQSDERWHLVNGNQGVADFIAQGLPGQIETGRKLAGLKKLADGRIECTFTSGPAKAHDAVVVAIPFTVLRTLALDASLGLSAAKSLAISTLGYGTNAKTMIGFSSRPWAAAGGNGTAYSDQANVQVVFETNPTQATATRAILTDYSSGPRGVALGGIPAKTAAETFLAGLNNVWAGSSAAATRDNKGKLLRVHREHWPSNPLSLGSYTCYRPGQFTTIAGNEGKPAGNLYFAGEHADSFYSWQGFMEGAVLSGIEAAAQIAADVKAGNL